jgi:sugar lactone lactonase YvrE
MLRIYRNILALILLFFSVGVYAADESAMEDCNSSGGINFICDIGIPEDLVIIPGTDWVIAGNYSGANATGLYLVNAVSKNVTELYSAQLNRNLINRTLYGACPGEPDLDNFQTHGLGIQTHINSDGVYTLYAVSHGGREAIEVFEIDASNQVPRATWTGCVLMPDGLDANDVTAMSDGTILATVLMHPGFNFTDLLSGVPTGAVYKWEPGSDGFVKLEGSELPGNNGIQVSEDGTEIFVAASGLSAVITLANSNPSRVLRRTRTLGFAPDNVVYDSNGYLLTAGMRDDEPVCEGTGAPPVSNCPRGTMAVAIHPETMQDTVIMDTVATPAFSGATMAILPGGKEVWVGSFRSSRIAYQLLNRME